MKPVVWMSFVLASCSWFLISDLPASNCVVVEGVLTWLANRHHDVFRVVASALPVTERLATDAMASSSTTPAATISMSNRRVGSKGESGLFSVAGGASWGEDSGSYSDGQLIFVTSYR